MNKDRLPLLVVKSDPFFNLVAIAMIAAIVLVFVNPTHAAKTAKPDTAELTKPAN
jgi:hypothetical protein